MSSITAIDKRLIKLLQDDAHRSREALAKKLRVSPATVSRRMRNLIKEGVIRIQAVTDAEKMGLPLAAVVAFDVTHQSVDSVLEFLANQPEVTWVASCTGRFDVIAIARFASTDDLSQFVQKRLLELEGVRDTETFVCLELRKPRFAALL